MVIFGHMDRYSQVKARYSAEKKTIMCNISKRMHFGDIKYDDTEWSQVDHLVTTWGSLGDLLRTTWGPREHHLGHVWGMIVMVTFDFLVQLHYGPEATPTKKKSTGRSESSSDMT